MKKLSGQCTLEEFFISMTKSDTLMNKYNGFIYEFNLFKKLRNDRFINEILIKPIIFYLKVDSFANSGENIKIDEIIKDIVATEDYNILCFLNNLSALKKREFTINFIAIQIDNQNNCSTKDIFNTMLLKEIIEVEYFFLKGSTSGVIDIKRIEKNISNYITDNDFIGYIKNYQKNLFQQILKLQPKDKKVNYVKNEFKVIPNFELEYEKIGTTNCIFNIKCVICGKTHSVSINNKLKDVLKAKDFFDINENIVELKCGHKETKYFGMVDFMFHIKFGINDKKYEFALLQYFYEYAIDNNNFIKFLNKDNQETRISKEEAIDKIEKRKLKNESFKFNK